MMKPTPWVKTGFHNCLVFSSHFLITSHCLNCPNEYSFQALAGGVGVNSIYLLQRIQEYYFPQEGEEARYPLKVDKQQFEMSQAIYGRSLYVHKKF